ncbi:DoxX family protein [Aggregicoccus sp. 17bor-14]|uniref:DoxX family protein n=1 Tax=Myxococcaceae TaxID=31 RepID=UPI00129C7D50|nr:MULTISPECIES: DoxX family protein [Myxococcaceae]MBF5043878.1 DoxX family protein [Simulacricoccus sp. 17bor-14]MRI89630.1 DoxX family protein [Aggregicoccus sp. 17bor-14]
MPALDAPHLPLWFAQALTAAFFAVLFLQSGLDKFFDWKGNLGWLTGHFAKSPLRAVVPLMLAVVTLLEVGAGALSAVGFVQLLASGEGRVALFGVALAGVALLSLFFGQRLAKDYAGAGALVPYFLMVLAGLWLLRGGA